MFIRLLFYARTHAHASHTFILVCLYKFSILITVLYLLWVIIVSARSPAVPMLYLCWCATPIEKVFDSINSLCVSYYLHWVWYACVHAWLMRSEGDWVTNMLHVLIASKHAIIQCTLNKCSLSSSNTSIIGIECTFVCITNSYPMELCQLGLFEWSFCWLALTEVTANNAVSIMNDGSISIYIYVIIMKSPRLQCFYFCVACLTQCKKKPSFHWNHLSHAEYCDLSHISLALASSWNTCRSANFHCRITRNCELHYSTDYWLCIRQTNK